MTSKVLTNKKNDLHSEYENCFDILLKKNNIKNVNFPLKENKDNSYIHFLKDEKYYHNKKFKTVKIKEKKNDKRNVSFSIKRQSKIKIDRSINSETIKLKEYIIKNEKIKKCSNNFSKNYSTQKEKDESNKYIIDKKDKNKIIKKEKKVVERYDHETNKNNKQKDKYEDNKKESKNNKIDKYKKNMIKNAINIGNNFCKNMKNNKFEEYNYDSLYKNKKEENTEKLEDSETLNYKNINGTNKLFNFNYDKNLENDCTINYEENEIYYNILEDKKVLNDNKKFTKNNEKDIEHYFLSYLPNEIKNSNNNIQNNESLNIDQRTNIKNNQNYLYLNKSMMMNSLINNIKKYTNYEYVIEKKLCYNCFISKYRKHFNSSSNYMYIDKYMNIIKNKKEKNESINNSFTFTYGFYCKKGKYHANEETASHTLFSSYKILKEISNLFNYMKKKKKYNFFEELFEIFNINSSFISRNKDDYKIMNSYINKENNIKYIKDELINCYNDEIPKVYVKFSLPLYSLNGTLEEDSKSNYHIIYNYFFQEKNNNLSKKNHNDKREGKSKRTNDMNIRYELDGINYNIKEDRNLMKDNEENVYYTHQNINVLQNYNFLCKSCKKSQVINKEKKFEISYFNYLFNVSNSIKEKKKRKNEMFYGLNDSNNSSGSDEYNYLNYSNRYLNKNQEKHCNTTTCKGNFNNINYNDNNSNNNFNNNNEDVNNINPLITDKNDESYAPYVSQIKKKKKNVLFLNEKIIEKYTLNEYLIKCKTCRYLNKYDNLFNDYLLNFCRSNHDFKYPFPINLLDENVHKFFDNYEKKNEHLKRYIINQLYISNYKKKVKSKENLTKNYMCSYSDMESYENKEKIINMKDEKTKKKSNNYVNAIYRNKSSIEKNLNSKREDNFSYLKGRIKPEMKKYLVYTRRQLFQEYYENLKKNKKGHNIENYKNLENSKNLDNNNLRNIRLENNTNINNEYDMHLFTICDGHSDSHASLFLIHNIHKIFYFLLIHTFFNIHFTFKLLYPILDLLYYKICAQQNLSKCCGSCIINLLIKNNHIYVSNVGDSKCALITFDLDKFEYNEKREKLIKKKKNKKCNIINEKNSPYENNFHSGKENKSHYNSFVINLNSLSYNELNSEHNCNNYYEYLRMYKLYYYNNIKNDYNYNHNQIEGGNYNNNNNNNNSDNNNKQSECSDNISGKKKKKKGKKDIKLDKELNEKIIKINDFILNEEKQINIGNFSYDLVKFNRLDGCLHPSRVIGDYDIKKKYKGINILSNTSNIYKYNMNNINFFNNIHYIYKSINCNKCKKNYILSSYGKINSINNIVLLNNYKKKFQNSKIEISNMRHLLNSDDNINSNNCKNFDENLYSLKNIKGEGDNDKEEYKKKESIQQFFKVHRENFTVDNINKSQNKKEKLNSYLNEQFVPYINIKNSNLNKNFLYRIDKKNFFHLLIIASDGVFEFINPLFILNILIKNKSIYKKIQKIYKIYNTFTPDLNTKNDINSQLHKYMITKKECIKLAKDIVKNTVTKGNFDDSTCFCIFLFPTLFYPL
ncbi:conserved Plasmodium protein, unknown function [Plasmodium gallinaceum]|uniref:PPM-type phosphatase domain-containing protein n=1 Tax=Plasmodium gallinaceum TaxID=5849 RepID=A0A1J1GN03_PLAGA|nr:conserved Plasmodium protein, unknown function [Plasmodium gallinaceum]CRG93740.1 conserved Plasmodium protein, unknown function [Plasmodium gallinaceum]